MSSVNFQHRKTMTSIIASEVKFTPLRWRWDAIGGPRSAVIRAEGGADALGALLQWIGYRVEITGDYGAPVWWGMVSKVTVQIDGITWTADIEEMTNRVAVAYTTLALGQNRVGQRATTEWSTAPAAIAEYGRRELLDSIGNTTEEHALARRNNRLTRRGFPRLHAKPGGRLLGKGNGAEIECIGPWDTLEWVYANVPTSLVLAFQTIGTTTQTIGEDHNDDSLNVVTLAQAFDCGATPWNLQQAAIYIGRTGLPAEDISVSIAENPDDLEPGTTLASATIAAEDIPETPGWVTATFTTPYMTTANATYFLVVDFGGTPNQDNYYTMVLDGSQGYAAGALRKRVDTDWSAGPAADMPFRLYQNNVVENADQIRAMIIDNGQFLGRVYCSLTTGISTESYRNGDSLAIDEIEQLMETGTAAGARLLARVNEDWSVSVFEEPDDDGNHYLNANGNYYQGMALLDPQTCPCGFWARTTGMRPVNVETGNLSEADAVFVESTEYDAETGKLTGETDGERDLFDMGDQLG
jgi:hypothetical protein